MAFQKKTQNAQAPLTRRTQKDAGRAGQPIPPELLKGEHPRDATRGQPDGVPSINHRCDRVDAHGVLLRGPRSGPCDRAQRGSAICVFFWDATPIPTRGRDWAKRNTSEERPEPRQP